MFGSLRHVKHHSSPRGVTSDIILSSRLFHLEVPFYNEIILIMLLFFFLFLSATVQYSRFVGSAFSDLSSHSHDKLPTRSHQRFQSV